jgi:putative GTP pyrophosphokinase
MKDQIPGISRLRKEYGECLEARTLILRDFITELETVVQALPSPPGIKGRVKDFASFYEKYLKILKQNGGGKRAPEITDIIGVRVVCPFLEDVAVVEGMVKKTFEVIEVERKGHGHAVSEFGYESVHLLLKIPERMTRGRPPAGCKVAEVQLRTILQDAWAEVEHELVYKAEFTPFDEPMKRKLAAVNANLTLADIIFQEIRSYQRQLNGELGKRRNSFFKKIETATDALLFAGEQPVAPLSPLEAAYAAPAAEEAAAGDSSPASGGEASIDDLLLAALYAHNNGRFDEAIGCYTRILALAPAPNIRALIYKHRGMAHFARSHYEAALEDFGKALETDPGSYKAAYYQGVVHSVMQNYGAAVEAFDRSLEINPYQSYCLYRRGQAWYHLEDYPQALADCEAALSLEPFDAARKFQSLLLKKLKM